MANQARKRALKQLVEFIIDEKLLKRELVEPLLKEAEELTAIFASSRKTARNDN